MKSKLTISLDAILHAEFEELVASRKSRKLKHGSKDPSNLSDCVAEAIQLLMDKEKKKGWKPMD